MANINNSWENEACGTLFRYKLSTPPLDNLSRNESRALANSSFTVTSKSRKIECQIIVSTGYYRSDLTFYITSSKTFSNINWLSHATLTNDKGDVLLKSTVEFFCCEGETFKFCVLSSIDMNSLKKFVFDVGEPFLVLYVADISITDADWSNLTLKMIAYNEEMSYPKLSDCCKFSKTFSKLYTEKFLTDVVVVADGKEFNVHKCILSARSTYFSALFKHDVLENRESRVLMKNKEGQLIKSDLAEVFIEYIYTGVIKHLSQYSIQLYELADMFVMEALQQECILYLKNNINKENAMVLLILSKKFEIKKLQESVFEFFQSNARDIFDSKNVKTLFQLK